MEKSDKILAVLLIGLLHSMIGPLSANAQSSTGKYSVTVNTPGTFGQVMLQTVDNWSDVVELTISGHLNAADMAYFSRMLNLKKIDVSNTDIASIGWCSGLSQLESIVLPETVLTIEDNAFSSCSSLSSFAFNNIESIGVQAFSNCNSLTGTISGPKVKTIGSYAFYRCDGIESISFPVVEEIGSSAFEAYEFGNTKLASVDISNAKYIGGSAFQHCTLLKSIDISNCIEIGESSYSSEGCFNGCNQLSEILISDNLSIIPTGCFKNTGLKSIVFPDNLKSIGERAFESCSYLTTIDIPEGVKSVGYKAFHGCPLKSLTIPSTLENIGSYAFFYQKENYNSSTGNYDYTYTLKDVYCKTVVPIVTDVFNNEMVKSATLHVPAFSVAAYKLDDNWYKFNKIEAIDGDLTDITINNTFTITDYTGLSTNANLTITSSESQNIAGHLSISGENTLSLNNYIQYQNFEYKRNGYYNENDSTIYPYCTTLITNNEVRANNVTTKSQLPTNQWSFLSMPYDVNVSSIVVPEGTMWVVRKYNGSNRAAMSGDTWENVTPGQTLNAGEGYIFHCINDNSDSRSTDYVEFEFPAINNSNKNNLFNYNDVVKTIKEYPAEFSHNRGWNLIGNPYPSYMSSQYVDFPAPITVWNGNGYTAYSLADDEYVLHPNEAFFVQCPVNTNQIKFYKDGRTHNYMSSSSNSYYSRTRAQSSNNRSILNLTLSDENYSDRTRIVLNEAASFDYNIETDASKFMSNNEIVPQIYVIDNGINYAINERPLGAGEFSLGVKIGKEGNYKISLNAKNSDFDVLLIDKATNETTNLTSDSYTFESKATTLNNRFMIKVNANGGQSSIEDVLTDTVGFSVNGNKLSVEQSAMISIYSIDGKLIFNGIVDGSIELQSGIFLLSINNITHKIAIK